MSARERRKGQSGERELAALLTDMLGRAVKRNLGAARDGGDDITIGAYRVEVKRRKRIAVHEFMAQAIEQAGEGEVPVVAMRGDGEQWVVMMRLQDAARLIGGDL